MPKVDRKPVKNTATVESLTARVKVLMIGLNQVTADIVKQLDEVMWEDGKDAPMVILGRVRLSGERRGQGWWEDAVVLIGVSTSTGELVKSIFYEPEVVELKNFPLILLASF